MNWNFSDVGGQIVQSESSNTSVLNFGWISNPPEKQHNIMLDEMPIFNIQGQYKGREKAFLWDNVKLIRKQHLPAFHQNSGSCTGNGAAKAVWYIMYAEVARLGDFEKPIMPYMPYTYAQGRVCANITGNQDGGSGAGIATAVKKYGTLASNLPGLPHWNEKQDEIDWPGAVDRAWGQRGADQQWVQQGIKHLIKTVSNVRSVENVAEALLNDYPVVICSDWGGIENGNSVKCEIKGTPPVLMNRRTTKWMHCMMVSGWWNHPSLGEIFHIDNSWGPTAHGEDPSGAPKGGFWISKADMQSIVVQRESYAYSQFDGFPADKIPWRF